MDSVIDKVSQLVNEFKLTIKERDAIIDLMTATIKAEAANIQKIADGMGAEGESVKQLRAVADRMKELSDKWGE